MREIFDFEYITSFLLIESEESTNYNFKILIRVDRQQQQKIFEIILDFKIFNVPKSCIFSLLNILEKISKRWFMTAQKNQKRKHDLKFEHIPLSEWLLVYKTDKVSQYPNIKEVRIPKTKFCDNDFDLPWCLKSSSTNHRGITLFL